jgi:putative ABC transport system permease protein
MIKILIKHSIRALKRQKAYVLINVVGLAIGIACSLIIAIFVIHEFSYDRDQEHRDRIHRIVLHGKIGGQEIRGSWVAPPVGPATLVEFPEVEDYTRINTWGETVIRWEDQAVAENHFVEADSSFFNIFSYRMLRGDPSTALKEPYSVVLTSSAAEKVFGDEDPMDKMIRVGTSASHHRVTGIMEDIPENSHFRINMIGSFSTSENSRNPNWLSNNIQTYLLLHPEADYQRVNERFQDVVIKYVGPETLRFMGISFEEFLEQGNQYNYYLQPLTAIHLDPAVENAFRPANDPKYLWIFGSVGLLILVVAGINFMNLSTAQATKRAKEVGIKKVSGSLRGGLIGQFLTETVILAFLALVLAVLITEIALPSVNNLLGINLYLNYFSTWYTLPVLLLFAGLIGVLAGSYPAFYLSSFNPNAVLKGKVSSSRSSLNLRSALTVLQFTISIVLIIGTLVMQRQIRYMLNKDLGYDKENVLVIRRAGALRDQGNSFKEEVKSLAGVVNVSFATAVPGHNNNNNGYLVQGRPEETYTLNTTWADYDFLDTWGIRLSSGRFFDPALLTDREACLINDRAVNIIGFEDPLQGRFLGSNLADEEMNLMPIIGTVSDFHFESLRQDIGPYMIQFRHDDIQWGYIGIRLSSAASMSVVEEIERIWGSFTSNDPMLYFFVDQDLERMYQEEQRNSRLSGVFTLLAVLIASLGLYGLTAFTVAQRTKEIGVRKTFGASIFDIWRLISKEILLLVGIATIIAWPLVYWVAGNWLQNFTYRISLSPVDFIAGFGIAAIIALATISYRTIRAASINPSLSLRYE